MFSKLALNVDVFHLGKVIMLLFAFIRCLCELQGVMRFLTRSYYRITKLCANKNGFKNTFFFFEQKKDNKYGKMVREMDSILLRD